MTVQDVLNEYFTEKEMCLLLSPEKPLAKSTLQGRRSNGEKHPPFIKIGQTVLYPKKQYYEWLKAHAIHTQISGSNLKSVK